MSSSSTTSVPLKFTRRSSSASAHVLTDSQFNIASSSSPAPPSSPLLTPLHLTRHHEYTAPQTADYFGDLDAAVYDHQDKVEDPARSWSRRALPAQQIHRPFPSLITKLAPHTPRNDAMSYNSSPFCSIPQTTHLYPPEASAFADDCEEYDLESMDIHIHETYFATSAERGRWMSSPIAPRVRSQAIPPMLIRSSPIKTPAHASPLGESSRWHKMACPAVEQISTSPSDRDEDVRSSPLPASSPLSSPMSSLSFLGEDCEDDSVIDIRSNSDDIRSVIWTPEPSTSTACTSPVEVACTPSPHKLPAVVPVSHPTDLPCPSPCAVVSRNTSPCPRQSPKPIDLHVYPSGTSDLGSDNVLSPLSHFEMDSPVTAPSKLPLSDTVNKPYPGQYTADFGVTLGASLSQDGAQSVHSLTMDSCHEPLDISMDTVDGSSRNEVRKRTESATGDQGARRTKKRVSIRSGRLSYNGKRKRAESHARTQLERQSKGLKLAHRRDVLESRRTKSPRRSSEIPDVERISRTPSRPAVDRCDTRPACPREQKTRISTDCAEQERATPIISTTCVQSEEVDAEFHASLTGMLVEALATSRATTMDCLALYLVLTQAHPRLAVERCKKELLNDIAAVLEGGRTRCGMFEKVDSSGEGSRQRTLENRWFYVPERDEDSERASLIRAIMPRQKRKETKKYKQYYYRPLDKICKWDPEDAP